MPKNWCAKLAASCSKRLEAFTAAKGTVTKYVTKAVNMYVDVSFYFFIFNKFARFSIQVFHKRS